MPKALGPNPATGFVVALAIVLFIAVLALPSLAIGWALASVFDPIIGSPIDPLVWAVGVFFVGLIFRR